MSRRDQSPGVSTARPDHPPSALLAVVGGAIGHAVVLAFAGYFVLGRFVPRDTITALAASVGLKLAETGRPWFLALLGAALGVVTGSIGGWFGHKKSMKRRAEVQQSAADLGAEYSAQADPELGNALMPFFHDSLVVTATNVLRIESDGVRVAEAAVEYRRGVGAARSTMNRTSNQTVAFLDSGDPMLPAFTLQPEGLLVEAMSRVFGVQDIDFPTHPGFSRAYHLTAVHAENTRRLFDDPLLAALARTTGLHIQSHRGCLALYRPGRFVELADLNGFVTEALAILRLFKKSAESATSAAASTPAVRSDAKAEALTMPGLMGKLVRNRLVVRADVEAFLQQPLPRTIPVNIGKEMERIGPTFSVYFGVVLLALGATTAVLAGQVALVDTGLVSGPAVLAAAGLAVACLGGWIWVGALRARSQANALLRIGQTSLARIVSLDATGVTINGEAEYRMSVEFQGRGGAVLAMCKIRGDAALRARKRMTDDKPAVILYSAADERRFLYTDTLLSVSPEYEM